MIYSMAKVQQSFQHSKPLGPFLQDHSYCRESSSMDVLEQKPSMATVPCFDMLLLSR